MQVLLPALFALQPVRTQLQHVRVTWDSFEPDTCASVWHIKRHVDPQAVFRFLRFLPNGTPVTEGTAFDTPEARLRRYATLSTYESILKEFKVTDRAAVEIDVIIHEIEINKWARKSRTESIDIEKQVRHIAAAAKDHEKLVSKALVYFDELAADIGKRLSRRK